MVSSSYAINVTAGDIARGVPKDTAACPIARAAGRRFKSNCRVRSVLLVDLGGAWMTSFELPVQAQEFMEDFDAGRPVKPLKFRVRNGL